MAGWEDVRRITRTLPGTDEESRCGTWQWRVGGRRYVPLHHPHVEGFPAILVRLDRVGVEYRSVP